jgi:hypothetical protein
MSRVSQQVSPSFTFAATVLLCYAGCSGGGTPEDRAREAAFSTARYTCYTAQALRDYSPRWEVICLSAPPPEAAHEVAGVVFEPDVEVTADDTKFLNDLPNLCFLSLAYCSTSRDFWQTLDVSKIRYLCVVNTNADDLDCTHIARAHNLEYFSMFRSSITSEGKSVIKGGVPDVTINDWYSHVAGCPRSRWLHEKD